VRRSQWIDDLMERHRIPAVVVFGAIFAALWVLAPSGFVLGFVGLVSLMNLLWQRGRKAGITESPGDLGG
jgi:hypothetical protein